MNAEVLKDLAVNVVANILAAFVIGVAAYFLLLVLRRRGMRTFFGLGPGRHRLKVYLSSIAVKQGGTFGTGPIFRGFHGNAITELEYRYALSFVATVRSGVGSWAATTILGSRGGAEAVTASIGESMPYHNVGKNNDGTLRLNESILQDRLTSHACVVLVGAPIYNPLTDHLIRQRAAGDTKRPHFDFIRRTGKGGEALRGIWSNVEAAPVEYIRHEEDGHIVDYFIIEKISIRSTKIFICAGTCTTATAAALLKLHDWRRWSQLYGKQDFGRLYKMRLRPAASTEEAHAEVREVDPEACGPPDFVHGYPNIEPGEQQ